jgi:hypothetical protein
MSTLPPVLSRRQLQKATAAAAIRDSAPVLLYNGSLEEEDFVRVQVGGATYILPPDANGTHPQTGEYKKWDGTFELRDKKGVNPNLNVSDAELPTEIAKTSRNPHAERNAIVARASEVSAKILEFRQGRGIVQLTGDEIADREQRRQATARWCMWRKSDAQKVLLAYHRQQQAALKTPGLSVEPMTPAQNLAQEFMDGWNVGIYAKFQGLLQGNAYQCQEGGCGYSAPANKEKQFVLHLKAAHQMADEYIAAKYLSDNEPADEKPAKGKGKR